MIFQHLLTHQILISRLVKTTGDKVAMSTITFDYVEIQPLSMEKTAMFGGAYGKSYVLYADIGIDIQEGDKIKELTTGYEFVVAKGGTTRYSQGSIEYTKIIVTKIGL